MKSCNLLLLFVLFSISTSLIAQDRKQLERERMQVIESIEETDDLIANSESDRQKSLVTLGALRGQIVQRNALLNNIKQSISAAEVEIEYNLTTLQSLTQKIKAIEEQYAIMLRSKYVRKLTGGKWITIFSASNINEAFLRWNYYRQFDSYRDSKMKELASIQEIVARKNEEIKDYALENSILIQEQQLQNSELQKRVEQQNELVKVLQKDKTILLSQLSVIKESRESLNVAIEARVLGELSGKKVGFDTSSTTDSDPLIVKGKVLLPISNGYIEDFSIDGEEQTKTLSISAGRGANAVAVAQGKVISVKEVDGYGKMIIIQHDDFYTIYANINKVVIAEGDIVEKSTKLGKLNSKENRLHFELWKDKERLDANEWIEEQCNFYKQGNKNYEW